jgi:hypothetical protein
MTTTFNTDFRPPTISSNDNNERQPSTQAIIKVYTREQYMYCSRRLSSSLVADEI